MSVHNRVFFLSCAKSALPLLQSLPGLARVPPTAVDRTSLRHRVCHAPIRRHTQKTPFQKERSQERAQVPNVLAARLCGQLHRRLQDIQPSHHLFRHGQGCPGLVGRRRGLRGSGLRNIGFFSKNNTTKAGLGCRQRRQSRQSRQDPQGCASRIVTSHCQHLLSLRTLSGEGPGLRPCRVNAANINPMKLPTYLKIPLARLRS